MVRLARIQGNAASFDGSLCDKNHFKTASNLIKNVQIQMFGVRCRYGGDVFLRGTKG